MVSVVSLSGAEIHVDAACGDVGQLRQAVAAGVDVPVCCLTLAHDCVPLVDDSDPIALLAMQNPVCAVINASLVARHKEYEEVVKPLNLERLRLEADVKPLVREWLDCKSCKSRPLHPYCLWNRVKDELRARLYEFRQLLLCISASVPWRQRPLCRDPNSCSLRDVRIAVCRMKSMQQLLSGVVSILARHVALANHGWRLREELARIRAAAREDGASCACFESHRRRFPDGWLTDERSRPRSEYLGAFSDHFQSTDPLEWDNYCEYDNFGDMDEYDVDEYTCRSAPDINSWSMDGHCDFWSRAEWTRRVASLKRRKRRRTRGDDSSFRKPRPKSWRGGRHKKGERPDLLEAAALVGRPASTQSLAGMPRDGEDWRHEDPPEESLAPSHAGMPHKGEDWLHEDLQAARDEPHASEDGRYEDPPEGVAPGGSQPRHTAASVPGPHGLEEFSAAPRLQQVQQPLVAPQCPRGSAGPCPRLLRLNDLLFDDEASQQAPLQSEHSYPMMLRPVAMTLSGSSTAQVWAAYV